MSHAVPDPEETLGLDLRWLVWGIAGLGALLVVGGTVLLWFGRSSPPLPMIIGFVLLVATVPSAKIKKFQVGPRVGLNIEFHAAPASIRASRRS